MAKKKLNIIKDWLSQNQIDFTETQFSGCPAIVFDIDGVFKVMQNHYRVLFLIVSQSLGGAAVKIYSPNPQDIIDCLYERLRSWQTADDYERDDYDGPEYFGNPIGF